MSDEQTCIDAQTSTTLTEDDLLEASRRSEVYATSPLTTPACPIGPQVTEQMKEFVGDLLGVHPKMVFDPPGPRR